MAIYPFFSRKNRAFLHYFRAFILLERALKSRKMTKGDPHINGPTDYTICSCETCRVLKSRITSMHIKTYHAIIFHPPTCDRIPLGKGRQ